jgi:hypothetical protein
MNSHNDFGARCNIGFYALHIYVSVVNITLANTGVAPLFTMALATAKYPNPGIITSSPAPMPAAGIIFFKKLLAFIAFLYPNSLGNGLLYVADFFSD